MTPGPNSYEDILKKREYVLRELVETEEIYVSDLGLVCEGYMRHVQVSPRPCHRAPLRQRTLVYYEVGLST